MNSFVELTFLDTVTLELSFFRQSWGPRIRAVNAISKTGNPLAKPALQRRVKALEAGRTNFIQVIEEMHKKHRLPCGALDIMNKYKVPTSVVGSCGNRFYVVTNSRQEDRMKSKMAPERHETALELQVFFANEAARTLHHLHVVTNSRQEDRMISKTAPDRHETVVGLGLGDPGRNKSIELGLLPALFPSILPTFGE
jgi:hypothetical protein